MKLYGHEVNQFNYKDYALTELIDFAKMLKSRIKEIEEQKDYSLFDSDELFKNKYLNQLIQREISVRQDK